VTSCTRRSSWTQTPLFIGSTSIAGNASETIIERRVDVGISRRIQRNLPRTRAGRRMKFTGKNAGWWGVFPVRFFVLLDDETKNENENARPVFRPLFPFAAANHYAGTAAHAELRSTGRNLIISPVNSAARYRLRRVPRRALYTTCTPALP